MEREVQTSSSRPISVSWIIQSPSGGQLGLCFCPGKRNFRGGVRIERDLNADLARLMEHFKTTCLVCLLNDAELRSYGLRDFSKSVKSKGLEFIQFPIIECAAPDDIAATINLVEDLASRVTNNQVVVAHCRGGVGRAGMIAACLLLRLGMVMTSKDAIQEVRRLRCKEAVETKRQEDFIALYHQRLQIPQ